MVSVSHNTRKTMKSQKDLVYCPKGLEIWTGWSAYLSVKLSNVFCVLDISYWEFQNL